MVDGRAVDESHGGLSGSGLQGLDTAELDV